MNANKNIEVDSLWRHHNGNRYRIVGIGQYRDCADRPAELDIFGKYLRLGSFHLDSAFGQLDLFDYQGCLIYGGLKELGKLVFYSGDSGR